jgi:hypothetical protein
MLTNACAINAGGVRYVMLSSSVLGVLLTKQTVIGDKAIARRLSPVAFQREHQESEYLTQDSCKKVLQMHTL